MLGIPVKVPDAEELSGIGAAYAAGISIGIYQKTIFEKRSYSTYEPTMEEKTRSRKYSGWKGAVSLVKTK